MKIGDDIMYKARYCGRIRQVKIFDGLDETGIQNREICIVLSSGEWPWLKDAVTCRVYDNAVNSKLVSFVCKRKGRRLRV